MLILSTLFLVVAPAQQSFFDTHIMEPTSHWVRLSEDQRIDVYYMEDGKIHCGETGSREIEVDLATFEVLAGTQYARDIHRVYYPTSIICFCGEELSVCVCVEYVVEKADPRTFRYLGKEYATDGRYVFFQGEMIPDADGKSVEIIEGPESLYAIKDQTHVFLYAKPLENADAGSFEFMGRVPPPTGSTMGTLFLLSDSDHFWKFPFPDWPVLIDDEAEIKGLLGSVNWR